MTTLEIAKTDIPSAGLWLRGLKSTVQPTTFKKGREYAEARRVQLVSTEPSRFSATVMGSTGEKYEVQVSAANEADVTSTCNCESWNKYGPHCKHVVAAALVYLARSKAESSAQGSTEIASVPALAKVESWLGLSSLPDFEFHYRLTPGPTTGSGQKTWVLDVRRQDASGNGPVNVKRTLSAGTRISFADEVVFQQLSRFESRFDSKMVLADSDLSELVDVLRNRRVVYRGTSLLFSESPARPQIRLESTPDGAIARIDLLLPEGNTVALREVHVLPGKRTYIISGQTLYALEPDFPQRLLRKWLLEPQMSFAPGHMDRVLGFFAAHLPRFQMMLKADGLDVEENVEPQFVLTLEGNIERVTGKLAARYGQTSVPVAPGNAALGYAGGMGPEGRKLYRRSEALEKEAGKLLVEKGFKYDSPASEYVAIGDFAIDFWAKGRNELPPNWEVFVAKENKVRVRPKVRPKVQVSMSGVNWFELSAEFATEDQTVDLGAVRMWLNSGRKYLPLKDGTFAEADVAELKLAADLLEEAGALPGTQKTRLPLYQAPALELLGLEEFTEVEAKARRAIAELRGTDGVPAVKAPPGLNATLRHYQEAGLSWMHFLHKHALSGILADDMGLGKTIQALSLMQKVKDEDGQKPSLVVAPTSVLANWEREAEKFTPELTTLVWHGSDRHERAEMLKDADLVLTSYALLRRDIEELSKVGFRYVILDEAQNIKNAGSATAQACKSLPSDARLALTGTPLENRLSELWSIFDFLMPGFLGNSSGFSERYEHPITVQGDKDVQERLRRRIHPFIMRRLKTEVAKDLPPKTETVAWCEMDAGQAALYREVLQESRRKVYDNIDKVGFGKSRVSILAALLRMRQVCCDPRLLKLPPGTQLPSSTKLERARELMSDLIAEGHRALVFSQFTEMLELLKQQADTDKVPYLYLDGRTKDRMARVDQFNAPSGPPVFFISLKAGGTGLNLTAADYVIHYDPWWNPAVEDQATDRTHRIGQTKAVISYKLVTKGTIEEKILQMQQRKRDLAAGVLSADSDLGKTLSEQDVEELFRIE